MTNRSRCILLTAVVTLAAWCAVPALAEPYFAVRTGYKCGQCHVNNTGGGKRTGFGQIYANTRLPMFQLRAKGQTGFFDTQLNETISVGGNLRVAEHIAFEWEKEDLAPRTNATGFNEANVYLQVNVIPEIVTFYSDQTLAPSSASRELFGMVRFANRTAYAKAGRMLLPYGLRIIDNDAFIRNRTGYNYNRSGTGLELGWDPGPLAMVGNITDDNVSTVATIVFRRFQVGGSYGRNITRANDSTVGHFAGVNVGRFTFLGEVDVITQGDVDQLATLAEMNVLLMRGFNAKLTYEFFDRNRDIDAARDGRERITIGLEPFIAQFAQVRAFYRFNSFIPQNSAGNQDEMIVEFHVFF